ncbi:MAG: RluA family pseudouridine synthase [Planctomycetaceae bacterium]|nr:RluA family pseudouridine synthase [Planctomycetaceae bacterium]
MPHLNFIVEPYLSGVRIDSFLSRHLRNYTTWRLLRMVEAGLVTINDLPIDSTQRVFRGQSVCIRLCDPPDKLLAPDPESLSVVWEDPWVLVIDKPAGLVAHPVGDYQQGTLANAVQSHLDEQTTARGLLRPGIVHRLDRMTSGLIAVTKEHLSHRLLSLDIQRGRTTKTYVAIVAGCVPWEKRSITLPIGQHPEGRSVLMSTANDARKPRDAHTDVRVLRRHARCTIVECDLHTGRNHQIRVHLAAVGHPVLGDEFYLANGHIRPQGGADLPAKSRRHALHASCLGFTHPILQTPLHFQSAPPCDFWDLTGATVPADRSPGDYA